MLTVSAVYTQVTLLDEDAAVAVAWPEWPLGKAKVGMLEPGYEDEVKATLTEYWPTLEIVFLEMKP